MKASYEQNPYNLDATDAPDPVMLGYEEPQILVAEELRVPIIRQVIPTGRAARMEASDDIILPQLQPEQIAAFWEDDIELPIPEAVTVTKQRLGFFDRIAATVGDVITGAKEALSIRRLAYAGGMSLLTLLGANAVATKSCNPIVPEASANVAQDLQLKDFMPDENIVEVQAPITVPQAKTVWEAAGSNAKETNTRIAKAYKTSPAFSKVKAEKAKLFADAQVYSKVKNQLDTWGGYGAILQHVEMCGAQNVYQMLNIVEAEFGEDVADNLEAQIATTLLTADMNQQLIAAIG